MKRYRKFMSGVKPSDTLDQRLRELKAPKKKPAWTRYGAMAAALVLVCGLGGYGLHYLHTVVGQRMFMAAIEKEGVPQPDIAPMGPGESVEPAAHMFAGSYEVTKGGKTASYLLPYIDYGDTGLSEVQTALDWDIPQGALKGDLSRNHIVRLLGGEDVLSTHLDWDGYELSGWTAWLRDGSFWGAYIQGYQGPLDHFEFAVTAGRLPPTCIVYPQSVEQNICGVMVTADGHDSVATPSGGVDASTRRVSFMREGYGFRFDLTSTSRALAEERVSRLVRLVADDGTRYLEWITDTMEPVMTANADGTVTCTVCGETFPDRTHGDGSLSKHESEMTICPTCGEAFPVGDEKAHVHSFPGVGEANWNDGAPAVSADPSYVAPAVSAQPGYTCPECGETVPAGVSHDCAMCDGYPVPHTCEICGEIYPEGTAHSHGTCGLPLAPDAHACEVCGQIVPAGMEHSHRQEGHHGGHH